MPKPWPADLTTPAERELEMVRLLRLILRALYHAPIPDDAKTDPAPPLP